VCISQWSKVLAADCFELRLDFGALGVGCAESLGFVEGGAGRGSVILAEEVVGDLGVSIAGAEVDVGGTFGGDDFGVAKFFVGVAPELFSHSGICFG